MGLSGCASRKALLRVFARQTCPAAAGGVQSAKRCQRLAPAHSCPPPRTPHPAPRQPPARPPPPVANRPQRRHHRRVAGDHLGIEPFGTEVSARSLQRQRKIPPGQQKGDQRPRPDCRAQDRTASPRAATCTARPPDRPPHPQRPIERIHLVAITSVTTAHDPDRCAKTPSATTSAAPAR